MGAQPPEVASAEQERRRRVMLLVFLAALVVILIVAFSVCSGGDDDDAAATGTTQTPATTQARATTSGATGTTAASATSSAPEATTATTVTATTTTTAAVTTTADPFAIFNVTEPRDVSVEWTCDEPAVLGSNVFGTSCRTESRELLFLESNFAMSIDYTRDADGNPVSMALQSRSWSPNCTWDAVDTAPDSAPVVDGKVSHSGVFLGAGRCEGVQWLWESTWDVEAHTILMTGVLEPIA